MSQARTGGSSGVLIIVGVIIAIVVVIALLNRPEPPLETRATGMQGLVSWLKKNDVDTQLFPGGRPLVRDKVSLRVLPIYDTDMRRRRVDPETREDVIAQTSERDLARYVFSGKIKDLTTLVVLPKWRTGMRALGMAHQDLLIPTDELARLLGQMGLSDAKIQTDKQGFVTETIDLDGKRFDIALFHKQTISAPDCRPVVGTADAMLLGDCEGPNGTRMWLLTDPDILNNHGLGNAQNGQAALAIVTMVRREGPPAQTVVDISNQRWVVDRDPFDAHYERRWDDFARMFVWPFTMIWIGFFAVGALVLWRAVVRYGPLARLYSDEPQAAKTVSISAKARLLRLANHDEALLKSHIKARIQALAADLLGPHRRAVDPLAAILPMISRSNPQLARDFADAATIDGAINDVMTRLDRFEDCHDRIRDEFGRAASAGRRPS